MMSMSGSSPSPAVRQYPVHSPIPTPLTAEQHHQRSSSSNSSNKSSSTSSTGGTPSSTTSSQQLLLRCNPAADPTVDYDVNVTSLYEHIGNSEWKEAGERCKAYPDEARTWVVRYRRDGSGSKTVPEEVLWRFLPVHSACALSPPAPFLRTLLQSHPASTRTLDDQGLLPLHYACGAKCSREVLYLLLMSYPQAALKEDPNGMLPLHYMAQWGPSELGVVDMLCVATGRKVATARDGDGNTCEALARNAEYVSRDEVVRKIAEFAKRHGGSGGGAGGGSGKGVPQTPGGSSLPRTPPNSRGGGLKSVGSNASSGSSYKAKRNALSVRTATTPVRPSRRETRDKYSSFDEPANVEERIDAKTCIEYGKLHNGGAGCGIEMSLSSDVGDALPKALAGGGSNNENRNVWNQMTPRSGRHAMSKLGVSPVHRGHGNNNGRGDRYRSWDGERSSSEQRGGSDRGGYDGGLNRTDGYSSPSARRGMRHARSYSWDQADPAGIVCGGDVINDATPVASLFRSDLRNGASGNHGGIGRNNSSSNFSISGSTWTTAVDPPSSVAQTTATAVGGPPSSLAACSRYSQQQRSSSTPRGFGPSSNSVSFSTNGGGSGGPPSTPQRGLPPMSPRFVATPKSRNHRHEPQLEPIRQAHSVTEDEAREPVESTGSDDRLDRRLSELREELGGNGSRASSSPAPPAASASIGGLRSGGRAKSDSSVRSGHSSSTSSHSDTSYGTQLTQQLRQVLGDAERRQQQGQRQIELVDETPTAAEAARIVAEEKAKRDAAEEEERKKILAEAEATQRMEGDAAREAAARSAAAALQRQREEAAAALIQRQKEESAREDERRKREERDAQVEKARIKAEEQHAAAVRAVQLEKKASESVLREEIHRLRTEKDRAEKALSRISMLAPIWSVSGETTSSSAGNLEDDDDHDDGVSKLTFLEEHDVEEDDDDDENEVIEEMIAEEKAGRAAQESDNDVDVVARLLKEKAEIESAIKRAKDEKRDAMTRLSKDPSGDADSKAPSVISTGSRRARGDDGENDADSVTTASTTMTPRKLAMIEETTKIIIELKEKVAMEKKKSVTLEAQVAKLRDEAGAANKSHGETLSANLAEVKSLRESLDRAKVEIDAAREKERESKAEIDALREKERESKVEVDAMREKEQASKAEIDALREGEKGMESKEKQWDDERKALRSEVKEANDKCWTAQNEESKVKAQLKDKELQWNEERRRLENEIRQLKESTHGSSSFSVAASSSTSSSVGTSASTIKLQLDSAVREAEDMRKFNAAMRKEHDETISELESELNDARAGKTECLSQIVTLQYQISTLEQELAEARDLIERREEESMHRIMLDPTPKSFSYDNSSLGEESGRRSHREMEIELYKLKDRLREKLDEAEKSRIELEAMKVDFKEKEHELQEKERAFHEKEKEFQKKTREAARVVAESLKQEFQKKERKIEESSREAIESLERKLQEKERALKQAGEKEMDAHSSQEEVERMRAKKNELEDALDRVEGEKKALKKKLESAICDLEETKSELRSARQEHENAKQALEETLRDLNSANEEQKDEIKRLNETLASSISANEEQKDEIKRLNETLASSIDYLKLEFQEKEKSLQERIDSADGLVQELEDKIKTLEEQHASNTKEEQQSALQQIRDLKKKIKALQESDDENMQKLWEANKLRERDLQDKEDEFAEAVRDLKKQHEKVLIEKEDEFAEKLRETKRKFEDSFRTQEESFLNQMRDAKKQQQAMQDREDELLKQINDEKLKDSFSEMAIDNIMKEKEEEFERTLEKVLAEKDEEFESEVAKLQNEIKRLKKEKKEATEDKMIANELEAQLSQCKKDLSKATRAHKSEMNKLANTIELQKSKEGRLQAHIQSLEKQIADMVNDYEERLQDAFYDNMCEYE